MKVEANNPKFNFLRHEDDPYRPYYNQKLDEFATGGANNNGNASENAAAA